MAGGYDSSGVGLANAEIYNPASGTVLTLTMSGARYAHSATLLSSGRVLVTGGLKNSVSVATAEVY